MEYCNDFADASSRRAALRAALGLTGLAAASLVGSAFVETAYAASGTAERMLVVLSLRGAADGLSLVVPHGDPVYYQARPSIAIQKEALLAPDSFFGLHPAFEPVLPMWNQGKIAAIHAAGQLVTTRSHFAAMEEVEDADPGSAARVGWLNRLMAQKSGPAAHLSTVQLGSVVESTQISGPTPTLAAQELDQVRLTGPEDEWAAPYRQAMNKVWDADSSFIGGKGRGALNLANLLNNKVGDSTVAYPSGDLGKALSDTARLLKANVGAEVVTVDQGSWDHHQWLGNLNDGSLKRMAVPLGQALAAFFADLGPLADRVTVVTVTEFGRRVKENGNQGLDHGHGSVMFVLGAGVKGGYYGRWPGLENAQDADLAVTTDYRDVLAEVVASVYPERSLSSIFPQLSHAPVGFMERTVVGDPDAVTPLLPKEFYLSSPATKGRPLVGRRVTVVPPELSAEATAANVALSYRWEVIAKDSTITKVGSGPSVRVRREWRGKTLQVKVSGIAEGYRRRTITLRLGRVR